MRRSTFSSSSVSSSVPVSMPASMPAHAGPLARIAPVPAVVDHFATTPEARLDGLLHNEHIWRARQLENALPRRHSGDSGGPGARTSAGRADALPVPSGFAALDEAIGGGWPAAGLTELLHDQRGIGELRLLLPALAELSRRTPAWIALIGPPHMPCADALAAAGVDIDRILLVHARDHDAVLWATEQALRSGTCSAVLSWPDSRRLRPADLRRLQIAARASSTWCVLARDSQAATQASMAMLRLQLRPAADERLGIEVLKCRGTWPAAPFHVELPPVLSTRAGRRTAQRIPGSTRRPSSRPVACAVPAVSVRQQGQSQRRTVARSGQPASGSGGQLGFEHALPGFGAHARSRGHRPGHAAPRSGPASR